MSGFLPWKVLHLDAREPLPDLPRQPGVGGLFVVFWSGRIPLGQEVIPAERLPVPAARLAQMAVREVAPTVGHRTVGRGFEPRYRDMAEETDAPPPPAPDFDSLVRLERPLAALAEHPLATSSGPSVSVVVCTRDRPRDLERCLGSLRGLAVPASEILVVDNGSRPDTTRSLVAGLPGVTYVREPRPGLSAARNAGVAHASGEIVAFTDDDVVVHPDWVARLRDGFADPRVLAVTGLVLPDELETEAQWMFERVLGGFGQGYRAQSFDRAFFSRMSRKGVPVWRIGAGANMAMRREVFDRVGGFDERLGAGAAGCSEDSELWYRLLAEGHVCRYEPAAVVFHRHREDETELQRQLHLYMRGHVTALLVQFASYRHPGNLYRLAIGLPWYYTRWALARVIRGRADRHRTIRAEIAGALAGIGFYLRRRRPVRGARSIRRGPERRGEPPFDRATDASMEAAPRA